MRQIRNAIVHEEGWLRTKNAIVINHIKKGLVELRNQEKDENGQISGRLKIKPEYIDYVLPQVRTFFQDIKI